MKLRIVKASALGDRIIGLLRIQLPEGVGMRFLQCRWIHTFFMRRCIDCLALDKEEKVVDRIDKLAPWRLHVFPNITNAVLELEAGEAERLNIVIGTKIECVEANTTVSPI